MIYGGQTPADLEQTLPEVTDEDVGDNVYTKLVNKLNKHFLSKKNKDFARFQFGNLKQESEVSLLSYFTRVKDVARKCGFQNEDEVIRDHLKTMINNGARIKAMQKNWSVNEILEEAELDEEIRKQAKEIEATLQKKNSIKRVRRFDNKHNKRIFCKNEQQVLMHAVVVGIIEMSRVRKI